MPSISTITPATFDSGRAVTLSGSGFGASQGSVLIGGVAQNVNTWSDTSIAFTTVRGSQSLGACRVDVVAGAGVSPVFSDTFDGRTTSAYIDNTAAESGGADAQWLNRLNNVTVDATGLSGKALAFAYPMGRQAQEQRYEFDSTGESQYDEVWVEFALYVPANWEHRASGTDYAGDNNKLLFVYNDDTGNTNFMDFEFFRIPSGTFAGSAYLNMQLKVNGTNEGFGNTYSAPHQSTFNFQSGDPFYFGKDTPFINTASDLGAWMGLRFYCKLASGVGANDSICRVWKQPGGSGSWTKILDFTDFDNFNTGTNAGGHSNNHYSGGYILGAHNTGYDEATTYKVDQFKVYGVDPSWGLS